MPNPKMTATVTQSAPGEVQVRIEHGIAASFSRAVDPRAKREIMAAMRSGRIPVATWAMVDGSEYGVGRTEDGRCTSTILFRKVG